MARNPPKSQDTKGRFLNHIEFCPASGCWLWDGAMSRGYGKFGKKISGKWLAFRAHRIAWELFKGEIPEDRLVLHKCDVRCCVNPDHLFLGTAQENTNDMMSKGRNGFKVYTVENFPNAKLTQSIVSEIRSKDVPTTFWMNKLGLDRSTINNVKRHKTWREI